MSWQCGWCELGVGMTETESDNNKERLKISNKGVVWLFGGVYGIPMGKKVVAEDNDDIVDAGVGSWRSS